MVLLSFITYSSQKLIVHYSKNIQTNDIALLKVWGRVKFDKYTRPIPLPTARFIPVPGNGDFAGWGSVVPNTNYPVLPKILQVATLPIITIDGKWKKKYCNFFL